MQTFLPYPDFAESARCLDRLRLGKQRVEVLQLIAALLDGGSGWWSHPARRMWCGYVYSLTQYGVAICEEWISRGYADNVKIRIESEQSRLTLNTGSPPWLGREDFHASHRSSLLRKDPEWYGRFGWTESLDLPYVWPVS